MDLTVKKGKKGTVTTGEPLTIKRRPGLKGCDSKEGFRWCCTELD